MVEALCGFQAVSLLYPIPRIRTRCLHLIWSVNSPPKGGEQDPRSNRTSCRFQAASPVTAVTSCGGALPRDPGEVCALPPRRRAGPPSAVVFKVEGRGSGESRFASCPAGIGKAPDPPSSPHSVIGQQEAAGVKRSETARLQRCRRYAHETRSGDCVKRRQPAFALSARTTPRPRVSAVRQRVPAADPLDPAGGAGPRSRPRVSVDPS